jgi:HAMP domain-containing protein
MPALYFTPAALGYLAQFILALLITGYFVVRLLPRRADRPAHRMLLTGFFACVAVLTLLFALEAATSSAERLFFLFPQTTVLALGILLLLQFAYRFPERLRPRWEAGLVFAFSLRFILEEVTIAIYRFQRLTWGEVRFRGAEMDYPIALGLLWVVGVFLRQSLAASARQQSGDAGRGGVTPPLRRLAHGLWQPFRDLWRPQGQAAATARALMLVYLLPFGISLLTILRSYYGIPQELLQLSRSLGIMLALAAFTIVYLNYLPETTSFMVRLVGATLVALLTVLAAVGWLATPAYAAQYRPAFPDGRTLRFTPNAAGGYDLSLTPFHFERDLGAGFIKSPTLDAAGRSSTDSSAQLDFAFPFFGQAFDRVYANLDGTIALGRNVGGYADYSYHYGGQTPLLMPLLLDLAPEETGTGDAFVRQEADRLIVTWQRVPAFYRREAVFTFQAILYRSGVFEFSYDGLPAGLPYRPDDEPSANVWVIGAVPGTSPPAPLLAGTTSPPAPLLAGEGSTTPPSLAGKHVLSAAEGGVGGLGPQHMNLASLTPEHIISSGSQGIVQDYYLDFRRHLHTLLLPLAYLMLGASLLMLLAFPWLFRLNLVKPLETLLAGVRRVNAGDLQTTMSIHYHDEIGFLTESFNSAAAKLHDLVTTLETRVAERTQALRSEMAAREAAQAQVLAQQRVLAAAEEREHLGRDLHDGLGQVMGYVNVQAQAIRALLQSGQSESAVSVARQLEQVAQDAHADVRAYILGIRTSSMLADLSNPGWEAQRVERP